MKRTNQLLGAFIVVAVVLPVTAFTQTPQPPGPPPGAGAAGAEPSATDLAKQTQNPVGDVVSVPLQFNWNTGGLYPDFFNSFQPVIPIHVSKSWTFIAARCAD